MTIISKKCEYCDSEITGYQRKGVKYCGDECFHNHRKAKNYWFNCSCCMAKIGLSVTSVSKLLNKNQGVISKVWKRNNIKTIIPDGGYWRQQLTKKKDKEKEIITIYHRLWIKEIKGNKEGFTWEVLWKNEKKRRSMIDRYKSFSEDEKIKWNKKSAQRRSLRIRNNEDYRQKTLLYAANYRIENKSKINEFTREYVKRRKKEDPAFRARGNMRNQFKDLMNTTVKGGSLSFSKTIGCSTSELARHLESKFTKGMTWDNYGSYWHVDHILPCASFNHLDEYQVKQCWHYTNLQPLEAKKNIIKKDKITHPQMSLLLNYA